MSARPCTALQWSHGILAMESSPGLNRGPSASWLQWSHGILAMESLRYNPDMAREKMASMEPWHFSHGEGRHGRRAETAGGMLQWSHGILAMERCGRRGIRTGWPCASMEPWHFSHGEVQPPGRQSEHLHRFNGAMAF